MKVVISKKVRQVASHRGKLVRLDEKLDREYHKPATYHERGEHILMHPPKSRRIFKLPYPQAHGLMQKAEREKFFPGRRHEKSWRRYLRRVQRIKNQNRS